MLQNGRKEQGMILQQLKDIKEYMKEFKGDTKTDLTAIKTSMDKLKTDTALQGEKIRTVEIIAAVNKGKIEKVDNTVWGIRLQMMGIATTFGLLSAWVGQKISSIWNGI